MNNLHKIIAIFMAISVISFSCSKLTDVNNLRPINQLGEKEAIATISQAQSVLYGTYGLIKTSEITTYNPGLTSLRGLTMEPGTSGGATQASYQNNEVDPEDYYADAIYTAYYKVLNNVNHIIEKTPLIKSTDPRKNGIIGEAHFIRALCHFELLKNFGYFFDESSPYGIVLKQKPVESAKSQPRNTVKETYDLILADLDNAILNAPAFNNTFYASSEAAMALKAKVLLYDKKYAEAAILARKVIESGSFELEKSFSDIFIKKIISTREVIFQTPYDDKNDRNNKAYVFRSSYLPSQYYAESLVGDNRDTAALTKTASGALRNKKFNNTVFNGQTLTADTEYFLRLDEIWLILAEAEARTDHTDEAIEAINVIRNRVEMPNTTAVSKAEILEAVRKEKILELGAENGEEWYDLVRYASEKDLSIITFKPGVTSEARYVLPLPYKTVQLSNGVVEQNPGY